MIYLYSYIIILMILTTIGITKGIIKYQINKKYESKQYALDLMQDIIETWTFVGLIWPLAIVIAIAAVIAVIIGRIGMEIINAIFSLIAKNKTQ